MIYYVPLRLADIHGYPSPRVSVRVIRNYQYAGLCRDFFRNNLPPFACPQINSSHYAWLCFWENDYGASQKYPISRELRTRIQSMIFLSGRCEYAASWRSIIEAGVSLGTLLSLL